MEGLKLSVARTTLGIKSKSSSASGIGTLRMFCKPKIDTTCSTNWLSKFVFPLSVKYTHPDGTSTRLTLIMNYLNRHSKKPQIAVQSVEFFFQPRQQKSLPKFVLLQERGPFLFDVPFRVSNQSHTH